MSRSFSSSQQPVSNAALRWFLRVREPDCSEDERHAFDRWLAADPVHQGEYAAVVATWNRIDAVATQPSLELERRLKQAMALQGIGQRRAQNGAGSGASLRRWTAIAAMIVLVSGTAWWWISFAVTATGYHTARGEQRTVTLADGTIMEMNTDTAVTVRLWGRGRQIIVEVGEAYFTVAHDPARPFEVVASDGHIHDIGTQFSVYKQTDRVLVAVESGSVRIDLPTDGATPSDGHVVGAGERAVYMTTGLWSKIDQVEPAQIAAWRQGTLRFDGISLAEAITEVERYRSGKILLADPALGATRIRGVFSSRNLDEFFTALPNIVPVEVTHRSGDIIISRR